jgi:hypothetical protein
LVDINTDPKKEKAALEIADPYIKAWIDGLKHVAESIHVTISINITGLPGVPAKPQTDQPKENA